MTKEQELRGILDKLVKTVYEKGLIDPAQDQALQAIQALDRVGEEEAKKIETIIEGYVNYPLNCRELSHKIAQQATKAITTHLNKR